MITTTPDPTSRASRVSRAASALVNAVTMLRLSVHSDDAGQKLVAAHDRIADVAVALGLCLVHGSPIEDGGCRACFEDAEMCIDCGGWQHDAEGRPGGADLCRCNEAAFESAEKEVQDVGF